MSQARRIKPKQKKKSAKGKTVKAGISLELPWGLIAIVLVSTIILIMLVSGSQQEGNGFGSGLRTLFESNENLATDETDQEIASLIETKSIDIKRTEKEFDFYEILPDIDQVMPGDLPESIPTSPDENLSYYLQAASFRTHADAEKLRARLGLKGFSSVTQAREVEGKGTYYRVRLGPFSDSRKAKTAKNKLQRLGVRPFVYSVQNG